MTKEQALQKTRERFTNLLDGKVSPKYGVSDIINYYESLISDQKPQVRIPLGNIERNFEEEYFKQFEDEESY